MTALTSSKRHGVKNEDSMSFLMQDDKTLSLPHTVIDDKYAMICGDCLEVLKNMKDCSVDVSFTSPPYNDSGKTERDMEKKRHVKYETVEYRPDWLDWQIEVIDHLLRVTKKYVIYNVQAILSNREDVWTLMGHYAKQTHAHMIWYKPNAQPQPYEHRIGNSYEDILVLRGRQFKNLHINSEHYSNVIVQNINSDRTFSDIHKALMSEPLSDEIIREFTQAGEIVFDPFAGLATTGVSCIKQNRLFVGCEISEKYYNVAIERLQGRANQYTLFSD